MAVSNNSSSPVGFLDLPGEIKNLIYTLVFQGANLKIDRRALLRLNTKSPPSPLDMSTTPKKNALVGVCRAFRDEAMSVLAKHTTLDICHTFGREDPLSALPSAFLQNISIITVDIDVFVHLNRKLLPSLKDVTLVKRVEGISDLSTSLHHLHCTNCSGPDNFLREATSDVQDCDWKTKQIMHLAEEECWTVVLKVQWECAQPLNSYLVRLDLLRPP